MTEDLSRYSRQTLFGPIGEEGQRKLLAGRAVLVGCGALGTVLANSLVRAGVGTLVIVDRDFVEENNLQRQVLFDEDDVRSRRPKAVAAAEKLARINSGVAVEPVVKDANHANIEQLVEGADIILDGTDNFETRLLINDVAVKTSTPWIYAGVIGSYGVTMNVIPHVTPCLRCVYLEGPAPGTAPTCDTAGVIGPIVNVIASIEAAEAIKILVGSDRVSTNMVTIDLWDGRFDTFEMTRRDADCPACAHGEFESLEAKRATRTTTLCGRDAVQVSAAEGTRISLPELAKSLESAGAIALNEFLLRFEAEGIEFTVFGDGRAIIKGTTDDSVARTLYARYIGG